MNIINNVKEIFYKITIRKIFIAVYLLITLSFLGADFYIQYTQEQNLSQGMSKVVVDSYEGYQLYEITKFLKMPVDFISQIKWSIGVIDKKNYIDFFSYLIRSLDVYPVVNASSIILSNGLGIQIIKQASPHASFMKTDTIMYKGIVMENKEESNVLREVSFGPTLNVIKDNTLEIKKNEKFNQNYLLFAPYKQLTHQPWFEVLKRSQNPLWIPPSEVLGANNGCYFTVVYPIKDSENNFIGIIMAHVAEDAFSHKLSTFISENNLINLSVVNSKGELMGSSDPSLLFPDNFVKTFRPPLIQDIPQYDLSSIYKKYKDSGFPNQLIFPPDGKEKGPRMVSFSSFPESFGTDWIMMSVGYKKSDIEHIHNFLKFNFFNIIIIYFCYFFLIFLVKESISNPLTLLRKHLGNLIESKKEAPDPECMISYLPEIRDMSAACTELTKVIKIITQFVPLAISKYFIKENKEVKVFSEKVSISHFFCDMGGFTHISEKMLPEELVHYISFYLDSFTHIINQNKGLVDQYVGDAISAFWGAPEPLSNHAFLVCHTALACMRHLSLVLNPYLVEHGSPPLFISFGVSCGYALVGNMGTSDRMQYTAIGSPVTASECLQELNRYYGTRLLADQNIYDVVAPYFALRPIEKVFFKNEIFMIYELLSDFSNETEESLSKISFICMQTRKAWHLYTQKSFREAKGMYESILTVFPHDSVALIMSQRCETFILSPPEESWDGIFCYS